MGSKSRVRLIVLAVAGLITIAVVAMLAEPVSQPVIPQTPARFDLSPDAVRNAIPVRWGDPVASGGGTRCREAESDGSVWRTCEALAGDLLSLSVGSASFSEANARALLVAGHPDQIEHYNAWISAVAGSGEVRACTTAGPLSRANVDGLVVVGSSGVCRSGQ